MIQLDNNLHAKLVQHCNDFINTTQQTK